jgi:hypothetical protein
VDLRADFCLVILGPGLSERQPPPLVDLPCGPRVMGVWWKVPSRQPSSEARHCGDRPARVLVGACPSRVCEHRAAVAGRAHLVVSTAGWGAGLSVPRVVRSSERSTQLPASFCWMCPDSLTGPFVDSAALHLQWGTRFSGAVLRSRTGVAVSAPSEGLLFGVGARSVVPPTIRSSERAGGVTQRRWPSGPGCRSVTSLLLLRNWRSSRRPRVR